MPARTFKKLTLDFPADLPLRAAMTIDAEERTQLPRRLFAMAGRRLELAAQCAGQGEAATLSDAAIASLAGDIFDCAQDLLVLADVITALAEKAAD